MLALSTNNYEDEMTPGERDRLVRTETIQEEMLKRLDKIEQTLEVLMSYANRGAGIWFFIIKVGAVLTAMFAAIAWIADKGWHFVVGK